MRPKSKPDLIEGPRAFKNFEDGMKRLFQVPKAEVDKAEKKYKAGRKRNRQVRNPKAGAR